MSIEWWVILVLMILLGFAVDKIFKQRNQVKNYQLALEKAVKISEQHYEMCKKEQAKNKFAKDNTLALALYRTCVQRLKLQVHEVDASLQTLSIFSDKSRQAIIDRLAIKNRLLEIGWLETGQIGNPLQ